MAPHHGSLKANVARLAAWASPRVVVSCQGPRRGKDLLADVYRAVSARTLATWPHGAVTVTTRRGAVVIETFATKERLVLRPRVEKRD